MTHHLYIFLCYLLKFFFPICDGEYNINSISNNLNGIDRTVHLARSDLDLLLKVDPVDEKVSIRVYYQCYCPHCIRFDTTSFASVVRTLHNYLDIKTYPYGKAKTIVHNGTYEFICPNGPLECYGNKLHACALDLMQNKTEALLFNSCMMMPRNNSHGSDDVAADIVNVPPAGKAEVATATNREGVFVLLDPNSPDSALTIYSFSSKNLRCAKEFNVDAASIEECAKGSKGDQLLKYYGDESKKVSYKHVPFILINGEVSEWVNFQKDVCAAFANPPPPCQELGLNEDAAPA